MKNLSKKDLGSLNKILFLLANGKPILTLGMLTLITLLSGYVSPNYLQNTMILEILHQIGFKIGLVLKIDTTTINTYGGRYARLCIL